MLSRQQARRQTAMDGSWHAASVPAKQPLGPDSARLRSRDAEEPCAPIQYSATGASDFFARLGITSPQCPPALHTAAEIRASVAVAGPLATPGTRRAPAISWCVSPSFSRYTQYVLDTSCSRPSRRPHPRPRAPTDPRALARRHFVCLADTGRTSLLNQSESRPRQTLAPDELASWYQLSPG